MQGTNFLQCGVRGGGGRRKRGGGPRARISSLLHFDVKARGGKERKKGKKGKGIVSAVASLFFMYQFQRLKKEKGEFFFGSGGGESSNKQQRRRRPPSLFLAMANRKKKKRKTRHLTWEKRKKKRDMPCKGANRCPPLCSEARFSAQRKKKKEGRGTAMRGYREKKEKVCAPPIFLPRRPLKGKKWLQWP